MEKIEKEFEDIKKNEDTSLEEFEKEIEELENSLEQAKRHVHPGKFFNEVWTCCQQGKDEIGCSVLNNL